MVEIFISFIVLEGEHLLSLHLSHSFLGTMLQQRLYKTNTIVHRCGASGSMRACHAAGLGSIPGRDKFPG